MEHILGQTISVDSQRNLRIVSEANGRQIIGYVEVVELRVGSVLVYEPILVAEQMLAGNRVNMNIAPVLNTMIVDKMLVNATSMIEVAPNSKVARLYEGAWERIATAMRAADAGIIPAGADQMPKGHPTHGRG